MEVLHALGDAMTGENALKLWLGLFLASLLVAGVVSGFFKARKIQPRGFRWKIFGVEALVALGTVLIAGPIIGFSQNWLMQHGYITFDDGPVSWWVIALEFAVYFIGFDTYFYWLHRWMHKEPAYRWVHKLHHYSTSPNLLTTLSVNPLESFINGAFVPLFVTLYSVHPETMALIGPTNILMGLYVHSGYEFLPRWWNKSWATKWFISATFHDQHHKYFTANFGGYTTIWDRICGTMRPKFEDDFANPKARQRAKPVAEQPVEPRPA